ncbi:hypothetical protein RF11_08425 [Thelohanellus kitauei]|uniref:Uncharacterized protein n=1 Tax=Thelohanellus kitauei TaxID=669202 RepID=A0A0C2JDW6_THEKT|nr:hypothetical protein RF11_08425 [Thelohanellus kitauei]
MNQNTEQVYKDNWSDVEEIINEELDEQLTEKAKKYNMTARHVKTLIYKICTDKQVAEFTRRIEESDFDANIFHDMDSIRITRKKLKSIAGEPVDFIPFDDQLKQYEKIDKPQKKRLKVGHDKRGKRKTKPNPADDVLPQVTYFGDQKQLPTFPSPSNVVVHTGSGTDQSRLTNAGSFPTLNRGSITHTEAFKGNHLNTVDALGAFNSEEQTDKDPDDELWLEWLAEFKNPQKTDGDHNDETDEDFKFTYDELDKEDDEEFRTDRAVNVSNREIRLLFDELEKDEIGLCVTKNRVDAKTADDLPAITQEERQIIAAQLQQHIQLLVQLYMICTHHNLSGSRQALYFIKEIFEHTPNISSNTSENENIVSIFTHTNINEAMKVVELWEHLLTDVVSPVVFGESPANNLTPNSNIFLGSFLQIDCWMNFKHPILAVKMMSFILTQPFFSYFPNLLPSHGLYFSDQTGLCTDIDEGLIILENDFNNYRVRFSKAETYLLIMGYFQYGEDFIRIYKNMLPTREANRLKGRFRWLLQNPQKMDFEIKMILMRGYVDFESIKLPLVSDTPRNVLMAQKEPLLFDKESGDFEPYWCELVRDKKHWLMHSINFDFITDQTARTKLQTEALHALNTGKSVLIPQHLILKRNSEFDTNITYDAETGQAKQSLVSLKCPNPHPLYNLSSAFNTLEEAYKKMPFFYSSEMKMDVG